MFKRIIFSACISWLLGCSVFAQAKEYNLSICTLFNNEASHLKEWIEYHKLVGVDHFYLYNNQSEDYFADILKPYIQDKTVSLINWPLSSGKNDDESKAFIWALGTKASAYENAIHVVSAGKTKWLVFVDVGEFLVPTEGTTLTELLEKYDAYPGVTLASDFFDCSKLYSIPRKTLMIESVDLIKAPQQNLQKEVSKTIFKPDLCKGFVWPPYRCIFKDDKTAITLKKRELRINHYVNRNYEYLFFGKKNHQLPMNNQFLSEDEIDHFLESGYAIEDQVRGIYRFLPELSKKMGY